MANLFLIPQWFFAYGIIFEIAFAIIALTVSVYAFKVYKLSNQKPSKYFAIGFLFISINYFLQSFLNILISSKLASNICGFMKIQGINTLNLYGIYLHMFFFVIGLITLAYMTLKLESKKTYFLLIIIALLSIVFAADKVYMFYIIASVLLIFIAWHYLENYLKNKQFKTLIILIAFLFLLFGNLHFIFAVNHGLYYVVGHFLELVAYVLILINLLWVFKK